MHFAEAVTFGRNIFLAFPASSAIKNGIAEVAKKKQLSWVMFSTSVQNTFSPKILFCKFTQKENIIVEDLLVHVNVRSMSSKEHDTFHIVGAFKIVFFSASNRTRLLWIINFRHLDMCLFQFSEITIIVIFMAVFSIAQLLWECWFRGNVFFARNGEVGHLVLPGLLSAENAALEKYEPLCLCQLSGNTTNFLKKYFCTPPEIHLISYFVKKNQAAFSFSPFNWPLFQNPNTELK